MSNDLKNYKDLVDLLLGPVRERPGMYLREKKISLMPTFIIGYMMCCAQNDLRDRYFDDPGFTQWLEDKHNFERTSSWTTPFLNKAKGDEAKALDIYFSYLEEYSKNII